MFKLIKWVFNHPLNRRNKIRALSRLVRWQIGSRLVHGGIVFEWINGTRVITQAGETGFTGNIYGGLHEFEDMAFVLHVLREGDIFVDVGANVGSYTLLACTTTGVRGVAFEPIPATFNRMFDNVRLNHWEGRVRCVNKGVGEAHGELRFSSLLDTCNHVLAKGEIEGEGGGESVEMTTLDDEVENDIPFLMKIDVEGFETLVLRGGAKTFRNMTLKAVIMELNGSGVRYGFNESDIFKQMKDWGFVSVAYAPFTRTLHRIAGDAFKTSGNTLFVRDFKCVETRLKEAPNVLVNGVTF
jgi:methyltransferase, FkbM family